MMIYKTKLSDTYPDGAYSIRMVDWDPRESGDKDTNRGPGIFFNVSTGNPQDTQIKAMAFYRDRMFLANNETIISSRMGDWDNFWLQDPDNITDTDPLDLNIASNNYTPVKSLIPFRDFLFVGTSGNTQYELTGSNNVISPLTAEFAPTAFYPMLTTVDPVRMNNSLFFYSEGGLYIYFGQRDLATEQAYELSKHIPGYLPDTLDLVTNSSALSMIFTVNKLEPNKIYCYRNQIAGEKVVQNAFFEFNCGGPPLDFIYSWGTDLYTIQKADESKHIYISRENLKDTDTVTGLDVKKGILPITGVFDSTTGRTNFRIVGLPLEDHFYNDESTYGLYVVDMGFYELTYDGIDESSEPGYPRVKFSTEGFVGTLLNATWGELFSSSIKLSPVYLRDEANNIVPGNLNLRYGLVQAYDTAKFDVDVTTKSRQKKTYNFESQQLEGSIEHSPSSYQVKFPIMGYAQDVDITITSVNPYPFNLANLEFTGKFKSITRFHNS